MHGREVFSEHEAPDDRDCCGVDGGDRCHHRHGAASEAPVEQGDSDYSEHPGQAADQEGIGGEVVGHQRRCCQHEAQADDVRRGDYPEGVDTPGREAAAEVAASEECG